MKLSCELLVKPYSALKSGELIQRRTSWGSPFGIVLTDATPKEAMIGYFSFKLENDKKASIFIKRQHDGYCLSYGMGWVIEPVIGAETYVDNREVGSGSLWVSPEGNILNFHPIPDHWDMHGVGFNIDKSALVENHYGNNSAPVSEWHLWHSRTAQLSNRDRPLYSHKADK